MRILHVGKYFSPFAGGIEHFLVDLMGACAAEGVEQGAIVHHHDPSIPTCHERFALPGGSIAQVRRVRTFGSLLYAPIAPGFGRQLETFTTDFKPDVVHAHTPNASAFWLLRSRALAEVPWVVHWHADVGEGGTRVGLTAAYWIYRYFEQALLRRAAGIVATSPPYLAASAPLARWRKKCRAVPLGLDPRRLEVSGCPDDGPMFAEPGALKVLFVGRLCRYKGLEHLIRAAASVNGLDVIIAGKGEEHGHLSASVRRLGGGSPVRLVGAVSEDAKHRLLGAADVLCLPSTNRHEAFGLVLVEAMAHGTPVIATAVTGSGMSWVVGESGAGWTVEPGNTNALASLFVRLRDSPGLRKRANEAAVANYNKRFRVDRVARAVNELYRKVLGEPTW